MFFFFHPEIFCQKLLTWDIFFLRRFFVSEKVGGAEFVNIVNLEQARLVADEWVYDMYNLRIKVSPNFSGPFRMILESSGRHLYGRG